MRGHGLRRHHKALRQVIVPASVFLATYGVLTPSPLWAAPKTWIGGNTTWIDATGNGNWTPSGEPTASDTAVFNQPNTVVLGSSNTIQALTMSGGSDLSLNNFTLTVGTVTLSGASTILRVGGNSGVLDPDQIFVNSGSTLQFEDGTGTIASATVGTMLISSGGLVNGHGDYISHDGALGAPTVVVTNNGTISAAGTGIVINPPAGTLHFSAFDPTNARIDLDGSGETGQVNVLRNQTLDIDIILNDAFSSHMLLTQNAVLDIANPWTLNTGSIDANNGTVSLFAPRGTSFIRGGAFTQSGGTITVNDTDGVLQFDATYNMTGGTLTNNGTVIFNANATIGAAANFVMPAASTTASLVVESGVTATVNQADFNPDGAGVATNLITINGGTLDLNLGVGADTIIGSTINLNGGTLAVTDSNTGTWGINGTTNTGANTGVSTITGNPATFTGTFNIGTNSTLDINAQSIWNTTNTVVNAGATLRIDGTSTFSNSTNTFTGTGTVSIGGAAHFDVASTFNMVGGTVDLDGSDLVGNTLFIDTPVTINAATLTSFGNAANILGTNILSINNNPGTGALTVNLDNPASEWTLNPAGQMDLVNDSAVATLLAGNPINLNGTVNVTGGVQTTARVDIGGTINIGATSEFRLAGGGTTVDVNTLVGGNINAGSLHASASHSLHGHGTISSVIDFDSLSDLLADDGTLTLSGTIVDVNTIGTADADGILNVTNAWNDNVAAIVNLSGGTLTGGVITNDVTPGINGFGFVASRVINNTRLEAEGGGTLVFQTAANDNDWDGAANTAILAANGGNLEVRDNALFLFQGSVLVGATREVFANGFSLEFEPSSTLQLANSSRYRSTNPTNFGGAINVLGVGATGSIQIAGSATFENGGNNTLTGNLRLANTTSIVQVGAKFSGGGALINNNGSTLRLLSGVTAADLAVLVQNEGSLQLGAPGTAGQVQLNSFQQTATGTAEFQLGGTGLNQFDRMTVLGTAALDGGINLSQIGGYVPAYLAPQTIISAINVTGSFSTVSGFQVTPNKFWVVTYNSNSVALTAALPGDANLDNTVNLTDFTFLAANFNTSNQDWFHGDFNYDHHVDLTDFTFLAANFNQTVTAPSSLGTVVPEPAASLLSLLAVSMGFGSRQRRRHAL